MSSKSNVDEIAREIVGKINTTGEGLNGYFKLGVANILAEMQLYFIDINKKYPDQMFKTEEVIDYFERSAGTDSEIYRMFERIRGDIL